MDETGVLYSTPLLRTLERKGAHSVVLRKIGDTKKRLTAAVTISASGEKFPLFLILKGTLNPDSRETTWPGSR
jgi:hypothetical protein